MYLVDTNVWLERLLDQARSDEVRKFLDRVPSEQLYITDFTFHSIGVVLTRLQRADALLRFTRDAFVEGAVGLAELEAEDMQRLVEVIAQFGLDFDDAYQYVVAERHDLILISFDDDFDRTERGRRTPREIQNQ